MKKIFTPIISLMLAFQIANAQTYTIEKWFGGKASATVLTFDDWSPGHGPIAIPRLKERQLTGTFFVTTANNFAGGGYPVMNQAALDGFEIANHTINHPELAIVDATTLVNETTGAKNIIEANVPAVGKVLTFCYPKGSYNQTVINQVKTNHIAAREFDDKRDYTFTYNFAQTEDDYYKIKQIQVNNARMTTTEMGFWMDHAIANNGLMIYTFHSIGPNDTWFDQITEAFYVSLLDVVASKKSQSWITTFANAVKYHKEARTASLSTLSNTASTWTLRLTDAYTDNATYNHPLSLKLDYNIAETIASISQNGVNIPFTTANGKISFNAIPDGGDIIINKSASGVVVSLNITAPTNNAAFTGLGTITLAANASVNTGTISNVTFVVNGTSLVDNTAPYSVSWTPTAFGAYTIQATATAVSGETQAAAVNISVNQQPNCADPAWDAAIAYSGTAKVSYNNRKYTANWWTQNERPDLNSGAGKPWTDNGACGGGSGNTAPTVSLTSPSNGTSVNQPASITIAANATDADGSISKVEFYNGTTLLNTDNTAPYSFAWTGVVAGNYSITAKAFDNLGLTSTTTAVSVTVVNVAPTVSLTSPTNNQVFATTPATVAIAANAADTDGTISKVEFYNGTTLLGSDATAPYSFSWSNVANGNYVITAKAFDNQNLATTSTAINISVGNQLPTVSLTSPVNGFSVNQVTTISIAATATDADGSISKVEFYNGTTLLNTDVTAPYSYTWTGVIAGTYAIKAIAFDNLNATTTSSISTITVNNVAPTVTLNTPSNNQVFTPAPQTVSLTATATDADGTISKVEFYNGATLLNTDLTAPYEFIWTGVTAGTYAITAKAYDNQNKVTTSTVSTITVNNAGGACTAPVWSATTAYNGTQSVQYNGIKYTANWWTSGDRPDLNNGPVGTGKPWTSNGTCTGRIELDLQTDLHSMVYPNPSKGTFTLISQADAKAMIYNQLGVVVATVNLVKGQNSISLVLISGVYFMDVQNQLIKLIIE